MSTSFDESCDDCSIQLVTNKISNKKSGENVLKNILPAFKIYRYFSISQVSVPVLLPENRRI